MPRRWLAIVERTSGEINRSALRSANNAQRRFIEIAKCGRLTPISQNPQEQPARQVSRSRAAQMITPLKTKLVGVEGGKAATAASSVSASLGDDAWRERLSPTSPDRHPCDITLPVALAASPRVERSSISGQVLPAKRRFDPLHLQSRLSRPIGRGTSILAPCRVGRSSPHSRACAVP